MNDKDRDTRRNHAIVALAAWLIVSGVVGITLNQWTDSPWILQWNYYGIYWLLGTVVLAGFCNGTLGGVESGQEGANWNTVVGSAYLLLSVLLVLALLVLMPSMGYAMDGDLHGWWWLLFAGTYFALGYAIMPTKKNPRKLSQ